MIREAVITRINRTQKEGKKGPYILIGLQLNGEPQWYNGFDGVAGPTSRFREGDVVRLLISEKTYVDSSGVQRTGLNFKIPGKIDDMELRLDKLEKRMDIFETSKANLLNR